MHFIMFSLKELFAVPNHSSIFTPFSLYRDAILPVFKYTVPSYTAGGKKKVKQKYIERGLDRRKAAR